MGGNRFPPHNIYKKFKTLCQVYVYTSPYITAVYILKERISGFARAGAFTVSTGVFFSGYFVPQGWCKKHSV